MMVWYFTSLSILVKSYQNDRGMIFKRLCAMKCCTVMSRERELIFILSDCISCIGVDAFFT